MPQGNSKGPLAGLRVVEIAALGPAPFATMMLADMGADVLRVDRPAQASGDGVGDGSRNLLNRGRRSVAVDLKNPQGSALVLRLVRRADVLIEGFRPSVMERLGLGPERCLTENPRLVYGRMTGYGQSGPLSERAGHDIDYIALAGALEPIGRSGERPVPPLNLLGDFGGGGMLLVVGVLAALLERASSGRGQVVDAAMVDGAALLCTMLHSLRGMGLWSAPRGENLLDGGAPFYDVYETLDGTFVAVGALEPAFFRELTRALGFEADPRFFAQHERATWPAMREALTARFKQKTRAEWCALLEGGDGCFAPVLTPWEAPAHPHNVARSTFVEAHGALVPAPAPRFSRTPSSIDLPPPLPGAHTDEALLSYGLAAEEIAALRAAHVIA